MKLKLESTGVRCRLSREEAQVLAGEGALGETISLPGGASYTLSIGTAGGLEAPQFSFDPAGPSFVFYISVEDAQKLADQPMKKGIYGFFDQGEFAIEVDVKDFEPFKGKK